MTESTYLHRLIARMGMPTAGAMPAHAPALALPDAPVPPVYDPFVAAEALDEGPPSPPTADPQGPAEQSFPLPSAPDIQEASTVFLPLEKETVREVISLPVERLDVEPPSGVAALTHDADLLSPQRADGFGEAPQPLTPEPATLERVAYTSMEASLTDPSQAYAVSDDEEAGDLLPPPEPEGSQPVIIEFSAPPQVETPEREMEPSDIASAGDVTPILESPAPRINIGQIVVEVVTQPEKPANTPALPWPRGMRAPEAPAPRAGLRSKRGFGLGQI